MNADRKQNARLGELLERLHGLIPQPVPEPFTPGWYRWRHTGLGIGHLHPAGACRATKLAQLRGLNDEIALLRTNTRSLLKGASANNALLTGPRGCGKTTLMHGVLREFTKSGLRVITLNRSDLRDLPALIDALHPHASLPIVIACDELSFADNGIDHLAAKSALDDLEQFDRALIYATSNRRHLMPEYHEENLTADAASQLHPEETAEEKISLADRFGLWLPIFAPNEEAYLAMAASWLNHLGKRKLSPQLGRQAVQWAQENGSMNGRTALQFVKHVLQNPAR